MATSYPVTFLDPAAPEIPDFITENLSSIQPLIGKHAAGHILDRIFHDKIASDDSPVFILKAQTGAGKSSAFVYWAYEWASARGKSVIAAQPRIVLCQRLTDSLDAIYPRMIKGETVGYVTGEEKLRPASSPNVTYVTHQIVNFMLDDPAKTNGSVGVVIIDEVHEGSLQLAFLMKKIAAYVKKWGNLAPIFVLASATLDEHALMNYYDLNPKSALSMLFIGGKPTYPIDDVYTYGDRLEIETNMIQITRDRKSTSAEIAKVLWSERVEDEVTNDLLVFFTGGDEFLAFKSQTGKRGISYTTPRESNSAVDSGTRLFNPTLVEAAARKVREDPEIARAMRRNDKALGEQRHYLSTTLLESGETISTLKYSIDAGWKNVPVADFIAFQSNLLKLPVSRSAAIQRRGRVGRKFPGIAIHLYSKKAFDSLPVEDFPATMLDIGLAEFMRIEYMDRVRTAIDQRTARQISQYVMPEHLPQFDTINHNLPTPVALEASFGIYRQLRRFGLLSSRGRGTQFMILADKWDEQSLSHRPFIAEFVRAAGRVIGSTLDSVFLEYVFRDYIRNGVFEAPNITFMMRNKDDKKIHSNITKYIDSATTLTPFPDEFDPLEFSDSVEFRLLQECASAEPSTRVDLLPFDHAITRIGSVLKILASGLQPPSRKDDRSKTTKTMRTKKTMMKKTKRK